MYAELKLKVCRQCTLEKPADKFRLRKHKGGGRKPTYESYCKECEAINNKDWMLRHKEERKLVDFARNLKRKFGLTVDQYNEMLKAQGNKCAICPAERSLSGKALAVDHNHDTLEIRGLLCNECNTAIGLLKENIWIIWSAIKYLLKFKK